MVYGYIEFLIVVNEFGYFDFGVMFDDDEIGDVVIMVIDNIGK